MPQGAPCVDLLNILLIIGAGVRRLVAFDCLLGLRCHNPGLFEIGNFNWSAPNKMRGRFHHDSGQGKGGRRGKEGDHGRKRGAGTDFGGSGDLSSKETKKN